MRLAFFEFLYKLKQESIERFWIILLTSNYSSFSVNT